MFSNSMEESESGVVQAPEYCAEALRAVLHYVYTDRLSLSGVCDGLLEEVLLLADLWLLPPAVELCQHEVLSRVSVDPCAALKWLFWADDHGNTGFGGGLRASLVEWVAKQWALVCLQVGEEKLGMLFRRPDLVGQVMLRLPCVHNLKYVDVDGMLREMSDIDFIPSSSQDNEGTESN